MYIMYISWVNLFTPPFADKTEVRFQPILYEQQLG